MPRLLLHVTSALEDCLRAQERTEDSGNEVKANGLKCPVGCLCVTTSDSNEWHNVSCRGTVSASYAQRPKEASRHFSKTSGPFGQHLDGSFPK